MLSIYMAGMLQSEIAARQRQHILDTAGIDEVEVPETGKRKYGLKVLKGRNQLCHVHSLAFLVGAVRGLDDKLFHEREAWCSSPAMTVLVSMTEIPWTWVGKR